MSQLWKRKAVVTVTAVDFSKLTMTDSEKFIAAIGAKVKKAVPEVMEDGGDTHLKGRKLMKIAGEVLSGLIIGSDSLGLKELPFDLLINEYKRLEKKATRPDSPHNLKKA